MAQAAGNCYAALAQHGQGLEIEAMGAATVAAIDAIDPAAGWPVNTSTAPATS